MCQKEQAHCVNTDHAAHKRDYSDYCSKLHREYPDIATLNCCSFKLCNFPDLQEPDIPEFQSLSATEEQADKQSATQNEGGDPY